MSIFAQAMNDTATVAEPSGAKDDFGGQSLGAKSDIKGRWQPKGHRVRGADGVIVETRDAFYTHEEVTETVRFWSPEMDPDSDEPLKVSEVTKSQDLGSNHTLYKVVL